MKSISLSAGVNLRDYLHREMGLEGAELRSAENEFVSQNPGALDLRLNLTRNAEFQFQDGFVPAGEAEPLLSPSTGQDIPALNTGAVHPFMVDRALPRDFAWYGTPGITPAFLEESNTEQFFDFSVSERQKRDGTGGSGIHLGNGYVLSARHVVRTFARIIQPEASEMFVGDGERFLDEWQLVGLPGRGSYGNDGQFLAPTGRQDGSFNDFALVHSPSQQGAKGVAGTRATSTLVAGERLYAIGDKTNGKTRVSELRFRELDDSEYPGAALFDGAVELGFSGGPVVDTEGLLVGILFGESDGGGVMVTMETMKELLDEAKAKLENFPDHLGN